MKTQQYSKMVATDYGQLTVLVTENPESGWKYEAEWILEKDGNKTESMNMIVSDDSIEDLVEQCKDDAITYVTES